MNQSHVKFDHAIADRAGLRLSFDDNPDCLTPRQVHDAVANPDSLDPSLLLHACECSICSARVDRAVCVMNEYDELRSRRGFRHELLMCATRVAVCAAVAGVFFLMGAQATTNNLLPNSAQSLITDVAHGVTTAGGDPVYEPSSIASVGDGQAFSALADEQAGSEAILVASLTEVHDRIHRELGQVDEWLFVTADGLQFPVLAVEVEAGEFFSTIIAQNQLTRQLDFGKYAAVFSALNAGHIADLNKLQVGCEVLITDPNGVRWIQRELKRQAKPAQLEHGPK